MPPEKRRRSRRKPSTKTPAKRGRPRDALPAEFLARVGPPPSEPEDIDEWTRRVLVELMVATMKGEVGPTLAASVRACVSEIRRGLKPYFEQFEVHPADDDREGPELDDISTVGIHVGGKR